MHYEIDWYKMGCRQAEEGASEAALAAGVRGHGCGGEVLGLRVECVSMASEVLGTCEDPDVEVGLWWRSSLAP